VSLENWTVASHLRRLAEDNEHYARTAQERADEMAEKLEEQRDGVKNFGTLAKKYRSAADQLDAPYIVGDRQHG